MLSRHRVHSSVRTVRTVRTVHTVERWGYVCDSVSRWESYGCTLVCLVSCLLALGTRCAAATSVDNGACFSTPRVNSRGVFLFEWWGRGRDHPLSIVR